MRAKNKGLLPPELARKISPWTVNMAEMTGPVGKTALILAMALSLYGAGDDHNGFLYLLGPWVSPALFSCCWSAFLSRVRLRVFQGMTPYDADYVDTSDDPVVMRLEEIFNSKEARRHLWHETLKISCILFAILWTVVSLLRDSLNWVYPSAANQFLSTGRASVAGYRDADPGYWFWGGLTACFIFAFLYFHSEYHRWCLLTWAKRELEVMPRDVLG